MRVKHVIDVAQVVEFGWSSVVVYPLAVHIKLLSVGQLRHGRPARLSPAHLVQDLVLGRR